MKALISLRMRRLIWAFVVRSYALSPLITKLSAYENALNPFITELSAYEKKK